MGPPPYPSLKGLQLQRKLLISTMPKAEQQVFRTLAVTLLLAPDSKLSDLSAFLGGTRFSIEKLGWWRGGLGCKDRRHQRGGVEGFDRQSGGELWPA